jgi:MSHA pilin protein MshC
MPLDDSEPGSNSLRNGRRLGQLGFTMIELIMVMVLVGVVAVFVVPRINDSDFNARGFHDGTLAFLRYAQKTAIAQRRTVCVAFTADSATLTIASAANTNSCDTNLAGPSGETPGRIAAGAGIAYQTVPGPFFFTALGQPSLPLALQVTQAGTPIGVAITVEAETGYVHD